MGWEFYPGALEACIRRAHALTEAPVLVTENGVAVEDDAERIEYVECALRGVLACLRDGLPVRGYLYWSLLDNFEWAFGYAPQFGIVAVDRATQERAVRPSGRWLGSVARANRLLPVP
jgi:beta-glucosidase